MAAQVLQTRVLSRSFGALTAVDAVDIAVHEGDLHAIVGPNGAGKTTLIDLLSGELRPSAGQVFFRGRDITAASPDRIARLGIGRSYQRTSVLPEFTCEDNCRLAAQAKPRTDADTGPRTAPRLRSFVTGVLDRKQRSAAVTAQAAAALAQVGLGNRRGDSAGALSHGEQRALEIAMLLAADPALLLLDEPLAGMGAEESGRFSALLRGLAGLRTVILVEHDIDVVFAIADVVTVMVAGRVLETGPPQKIRASAAVQDAYLGPAVPAGAAAGAE